MRSYRFLLPFLLGALSMLALVVAAGRVAPGVLGRMYAAAAPATSTGEEPSDDPVQAQPPLAQLPSPVSPGSAGAKLLIPVRGVDAASLVDTYEQARGEGRRHDAIDIVAPRGTPVLATSDGVVMKLFQSVRGGTTLYELAPDQRTVYYYAHLDRYAPTMAEGRVLHRGEVLGYVGNTGDAGPGNYHLHFEVSTTRDPQQYWGGVPRNPYPLLR